MSERGASALPAAPPKLPGFPSNVQPIVWEGFEGLNTHVNRVAIKPTEMSVCDGWMPFGPSYLLTLPGTAPTFWDGYGSTIVFIAFGNIADTTYLFALYSDGSMFAVPNAAAGATPATSGNQFMPPGTITNPSSILGFSQWGSQYIIISAAQTNGYWLWDGNTLFGAGGLSPNVTLTNSGLDYNGSQPTFDFQTTGAGTGATFSASQITNGSIDTIIVTNPGTGFAVGDFNVLAISGGGSDNTAIATASILPGAGVTAVQVINGGKQYSDQSYAQITGDGTGASVSLQASLGTITGINVINPGTLYTTATIQVIDPTGIGTGFQGNVQLSGGQIATPIVVFDGGTGYVTPPVVIIEGDGQDATAYAEISGGAVVGLVIVNPGFGYSKALIRFTGGNNAASATVTLMPFGVSGTYVEVAFSRVWVTNGAAPTNTPPKNRTVFTAPGDPSDFSPADGAGAFPSTDSFLRVGYHAMKQTNGFLYLIGDSSENYISGVQTGSSGTPPVVTTTFTNANTDPQIGSPWPSSVQVFARNIVLANTSGVYVSYGGAVTKISDDIDGLYGSANLFSSAGASNQNFSSAVHHMFGVAPVYMLLLPVVDPITNTVMNKFLVWNGRKWFTSGQDRSVSYIATQEINSILTAWGTDGNAVFPLFTDFVEYPRKLQSKLWAVPSYYYTKTNQDILGIAQAFDSAAAILNFTIDCEAGSNGIFEVPLGSNVVWVNDAGAVVGWENAAHAQVSWVSNTPAGLPTVFGPMRAGQNGRLIGCTITTSMKQGALNSVTLLGQVFETNV